MSAQGDHRLRRRQRQHVAGARQRQHGEGPAAELGVVEPLDHERTEEERPGGADHADPDDDQHQGAKAGPELDELVAGGEPRQPRQQCCLDRLEHEQRNPRHQDAVRELRDELGFFVVGQQGGGNDTRVEERGAEDGADEQPAEVRCHLVPARLGSRWRLEVSACGDETHREERGQPDREPVRSGGRDADGCEHQAEHDAHDAIGSHDDRVVAEASGSRADATGEVRWRVGDERHRERPHHDPVAVEVVLRDHRAENGEGEEDDTGEHRTERHHPPDDGLAALTVGPAVGERPAELLFEREEEPGRQRERREPQGRDRFELRLTTERTRADAEERIGRDARDQQRDADGEGALGKWRAALRRIGSGGHQDHESIWRPRQPGVMCDRDAGISSDVSAAPGELIRRWRRS